MLKVFEHEHSYKAFKPQRIAFLREISESQDYETFYKLMMAAGSWDSDHNLPIADMVEAGLTMPFKGSPWGFICVGAMPDLKQLIKVFPPRTEDEFIILISEFLTPHITCCVRVLEDDPTEELNELLGMGEGLGVSKEQFVTMNLRLLRWLYTDDIPLQIDDELKKLIADQ